MREKKNWSDVPPEAEDTRSARSCQKWTQNLHQVPPRRRNRQEFSSLHTTMRWTGAQDGREVNPNDVESEEGLEPVVEMASDTAVGDTHDGQWSEEEEAATCAAAWDAARRPQSQGQGEMGRQTHTAPVLALKTTGLEATGDGDDDEPSSQVGWKKHELTVLMHALQEVLGVKITDQVVDWLKKESVTSVTCLLLMGSGGLEATGWPLKEVE